MILLCLDNLPKNEHITMLVIACMPILLMPAKVENSFGLAADAY